MHGRRCAAVRSRSGARYACDTANDPPSIPPMPKTTLDDADPRDRADNAINQDLRMTDAPQLGAVETGTTLPPGRDTARDRQHEGIETGAARADLPLDARGMIELHALQPRDRAIVDQAVLLRLLSYDQVQRLTFDGVHRTEMRRRMRALERGGWLGAGA